MEIMAIQQAVPPRHRSLHTLFLIAEATYRPRYDPPRPSWYEDWVAEVQRSILAGEKTYLRSRRFDRLLSLLFPEMAPRLSKLFGTEHYKPPPAAQMPAGKSGPASIEPLSNAPPSSGRPGHQKLHSPSWLTGPDLEHWKSQNPENARIWEADYANQRLPPVEPKNADYFE